MREELKTFLTHLVTVILAMEIRGFFEKGGGQHDLAFTILKILLLSIISVGIINMEDVTRVIIHKMDPSMGEPETNGVLSITKLLKQSGYLASRYKTK